MPGSFQIDTARRIVFSRAWGAVTDATMRAHVLSLAADPRFDPDFGQIVDLREAVLNVSREGVRFNVDHAPFSAAARRAFVVSTEFAYGLGRMYQLLSDADDRVLVCRTLPEAFVWIGLDPDTPWPATESPAAP